MKQSELFMQMVTDLNNSIKENDKKNETRHKEVTKKIDDVKDTVGKLELSHVELRKDVQYLRTEFENNKLKCHNNEWGLSQLKERTNKIEVEIAKPKDEVNEIKYNGYFWYVKQFLKMNNKHKFGTVLSILLLIGGLSIIAIILWLVIPGLFEWVGSLL